MKNTIVFLFAILLSTIISFKSHAQSKISLPAEGKAVIYFVRTAGLGAMINFRFFEKGKYLGKFQGIDFLRYECEPGENVFWVKAENIDFIETNFEANKVYIVQVRPVAGAFSSGVKFKLVDYSDPDQMERLMKVIENENGVTFSQEELDEGQMQFSEIIQEGMIKVQKKLKKGKKIKRINPDMFYQI